MLGLNQQKTHKHLLFNENGLIKIEKCPKCGSNRFNLIDHNNWFHCWECRLVCLVSEIKGEQF